MTIEAQKNGEASSLADRIELQRNEIAKAMSIIEACRMGSDSMLASLYSDGEDDEADFDGALATAWSLLNSTRTALEIIGRIAQRP